MSAKSPTPEAILQLGFGFWGSKVLLSAIELGLFTELAAGPQRLEALQTKLALHERGARDFLDSLVALHLLDRTDGLYANSVDADLFLDRAKPSYIGGLLEMANKRLYPFWGGLTEALRTGKPQNEAKDGGDDPFAAIYADPKGLENFLRAMTGVSLPTAQALARVFPWRNYQSFADIGCAQGGLSVVIAKAHSHLTGVGFDLPQVGPFFDGYIRTQGLSDRLAFRGGNFFADPLPGVDVLIMGHILHDWGLSQKKQLVAKAFASLQQGGALLVYDAMIDDDRRENAFGFLMSLNMLIETPAGYDYTGADCIGWLREAGFSEARVERLDGPTSVAIAIK